MKTVNKILLAALGLLIFGIVMVFISLRTELSKEVHRGSGHIVSEVRTEAAFTEIGARGHVTIHLEQADQHDIRVEADDNLMGLVETKVRRGRLNIRLTNPVHPDSNINVFVRANTINRIEGAASCHFVAEEALSGSFLGLHLSSGAKSTLLLAYDTLEVELKSGAFAKLSGSTQTISVEGSSGSILNAKELHAIHCDVASKTGSQLTVYASERLQANSKSGGQIYYYGEPSIKSWNKSFGGEIIKK